MPRYCLLGHVNPARLDEYRQRHAAVSPDLLHALAAAGWRNYSLFLRDDGLLVGYVEAHDLAAARAAMARLDVNSRWQQRMSEYFDLDGTRPDEGFQLLEQVFQLEDQLAALPGGDS